jgi:hypothetical protein
MLDVRIGASTCRFMPPGISRQETEEIEGKIASRGAGNSGRKKCFHLRRGLRLMEKLRHCSCRVTVKYKGKDLTLTSRGKRHLELRCNADLTAPLSSSGRGAHGGFSFATWIHWDAAGAKVRSLHSPKRDHAAATRVTTDVGAILRNHANGRAQSTNDGSVSSTHYVSPLLLQTAPPTKSLPVVQLRSGVILLMGDPYSFSLSGAPLAARPLQRFVGQRGRGHSWLPRARTNRTSRRLLNSGTASNATATKAVALVQGF